MTAPGKSIDCIDCGKAITANQAFYYRNGFGDQCFHIACGDPFTNVKKLRAEVDALAVQVADLAKKIK